MTKTSRTAFLWVRSDNPESAIQNLKWLRLSVIAFLLVVAGAAVEAQQPAGKVPRIGFLTTGSASDPLNALRLDAFRQGLRDLGYVEGKTINIEYRYAEGRSERLVESS